MYDLCPGLAVRQPGLALVEVDVLPLKGLDLAQPASGQQKEAKRGHRVRAFRFRVRKRTAERFDRGNGYCRERSETVA